MNILWQQPDGTLALTSIFDGSDPATLGAELQTRGDIPANWVLLATGVTWPTDGHPQEAYRWDSVNKVVAVDATALAALTPPLECNAAQIRLALTQQNLRTQVENAVSASTDQNLKDLWQYSPKFAENDPHIVAMATAINVNAAALHALFQLAVTL